MRHCLRTLVSAVLCAVALGSWAQAPLSGTYHVKGANGKYVELKGKYYAKPDASAQSQSTKINLGVGYSTGDGYRVYSLTGTNPTDGSTIEVMDYVQKACNIVSKFAQEKMNGKIESKLKELMKEDDGSVSEENQQSIDQIVGMLDAMADSVCRIYTDDYAYMTLVPEGHYGDRWVVRAKATVPAIPHSIKAIGDHYTKGHVVNAGHACTDLWDWAKQHVLKYLAGHQTDAQLQALVKTYLDQVEPGTTYYLTCEDNETFGYATTLTDAGLWTLEEVPASVEADGLTPGVYNIQNQQTQRFVNMKGKYDAAPELTLSDIQGSLAYKKSAAFSLDFGRYDKTDANLYRITELANDASAIDACAYITKGMNKAYELIDKKLKEKDLYSTLATKLKDYTGVTLTADQISADVKTAIDLCAQHYAYLTLRDNGDQTVSLYVDVPQVPLMLDFAAALYQQMYQGKGNDDISETPFEDMVKEQLDKYFNDATSNTDQHLRNLWKQNRDKWSFGKRYYLAADQYNTFDFAETATEYTKWLLTDVQDAESSTNPLAGYYRVKNVGGYENADGTVQQYVEVKGRASADVATAGADKFTKAGTVIYLNLDNNATDIMAVGDSTRTVKAYEVLNLRSQGIDVMGGAEASMNDLAEAFGDFAIGDDANITPAYNGYVGFARLMLKAIAQLGEQKIANHASDWWEIPEGKKQGTQADIDKCKAVLDDFVENYLPELKLKVYLIPSSKNDGSYYIRSMVPSLKPIADFYKTHKADMDTLVIPCMDRFLRYQGQVAPILNKVGFKGEYFTYADEGTVRHWNGDTYGLWDYAEKDEKGNLKKYSSEMKTIDNGGGNTATTLSWKEDPSGEYYRVAYSTILNNEWLMFNWLKLQAWHALAAMGKDGNSTLGGYLSMIHYGVPYFLIQGDNHNAEGNREYVGNTSLGFANDGAVHGTYNDLANAGDHALWQLEPVDETNYFAVKPNKNQGKNGKYYTATYVDFPFQPVGNNVTAVYALNEKGVQDGSEEQTGTDGQTTTVSYKYVTFDKQTGAIPAATPTIIETSQPGIDETIAIVPVANGERSEKNDLIQGTFFGGYHNVDLQTGAETEGLTATLKALLNQYVNGSIQAKYNVDTDDQDLYLWGYNKKDERNPYGFYLYSKAGEYDNKWNIIPGNKPFLILNPNDSNAKVYVSFGDGETTSIDEVFSGEDTVPANAVRYNLAGQRVTKDYKGIVVVNGQKLIQK